MGVAGAAAAFLGNQKKGEPKKAPDPQSAINFLVFAFTSLLSVTRLRVTGLHNRPARLP
jgi:hypothetical protein